MGKVLYIKANPKEKGRSRTFQISDAFIEEYKKHNPKDEIVILDLYEERIQFLTGEDLDEMPNAKKEEAKQHPVFRYAYEFLGADKYVMAEPMWNLNIPAILKAYIDYICIAGVTFQYTDKGPVGLCHGKKAVNITTMGGKYSNASLETLEIGDRYLKKVFGFVGIKEYYSISAETLDVKGSNVEGIIKDAIEEARTLAKTF